MSLTSSHHSIGGSISEWTSQLLSWVQNRGKILILMHENPDPDSLAAAAALRTLFLSKSDHLPMMEPTIAFSGMIARRENLVMASELEIFLTPFESLSLDDYPVRCLVDCQPGAGNCPLPPHTRVDIVIDHHPLRTESAECQWTDIRTDYGITSTLVYEYLLAQNIPVPQKLATALFYAIKSETQDLGREANAPDKRAYHELFPLANKRLLNAITHPKLPVAYFEVLHQALERAEIHGTVLIARLGDVDFPEITSEMADLLLRLDGIQTVLSIAHYGNDMILSLRTSSPEVNSGDLIAKIAEGYGKAGGHGMMAGGKISPLPSTVEARAALEKTLVSRLLSELHLADSLSVSPSVTQWTRLISSS